MQLAIGDLEVPGWVITLPDNRDVVGFVFEVTIDTVVADIQCAVVVPANVQIVLGKRNVLHFAERFDPVDPLPLLRPKTFVVIDGARIQLVVSRFVDQRTRLRVGNHGIDSTHFSCLCNRRCACTKCGRSIISPSMPSAPAPGLLLNSATMRSARSISSTTGTNALLMTSTCAG